MLSTILDIYATEDVLVKMNIVQVVSVLGGGVQSSKVLYENKIWGQIEKEAMVKFYVM